MIEEVDRKADRNMFRLIGFYDYTVMLTYLSLISSTFGMIRAFNGDYKIAILCLAFSGICDAFDGRVARTKKNRTKDEKNYGIQLDSLCDVICFGAFPAILCYFLGVSGIVGMIIIFMYCTCAVIRLAYFNVLEAKRQESESGCNKVYHGLPVTSISFIFPVVFWLQFLMPANAFLILLHVMLAVVGFLFVLDFQLRKPSLKTILIIISVAAVTVGSIFAYTKLKSPNSNNRSKQIADELIEGAYEAENP